MINPHKAVCRMLHKPKEYIKGGMADGHGNKCYNKTQLMMGRKIEMEHTNKRKIAEEISRDHLQEFPDYYTHLEAMEKEMKHEKRYKR